jgi:YidC/Oxa1 family membrane protein insertase
MSNKLFKVLLNFIKFSQLRKNDKLLCFYSENLSSLDYFQPLLNILHLEHKKQVVYITSDETEYNRLKNQNGIIPIYIGFGIFRTTLFRFINTKVMVMTMPDLETYFIKRSIYPVNYVYVHHSIVSSHMVYKPNAFDNFDTIFCVGPHHIKEIRAWENSNKLKQKKLVLHGYGKLDTLILTQKSLKNVRTTDSPIRILIAPSWGKNSIIERHGGDFLESLLENNFQVVLRPHQQTRHYNSNILNIIEKKYEGFDNFIMEKNGYTMESILNSDILITDWSGIAMEFAFTRLKPVLFVDVPKKINNPAYKNIEIEPIEILIRDEIGVIMPETELDEISKYIYLLLNNSKSYEEKIKVIRNNSIFNIEKSGNAGAKEIINLLNEKNRDGIN